jgi:DNA repair protein RadD
MTTSQAELFDISSQAKTYTLRPYQRDAVESSVNYLADGRRDRHGIVVAPTGSGKSLVIANIVDRLPGDTLVFQPTKEILEQNAAKLASYGCRPKIYSASFGSKQIGSVTLATIGSVHKAVAKFSGIPYVLIDECHLVNPKGGMYRDFVAAMAGSRILGLTATPFRLASNSFGSELRFLTRTRPRIFRDLVHYSQITDLFADGYLCPLEYRDSLAIDTSLLKPNSTGADYTDASVERSMGRDFFGRLVAETKSAMQSGRKPLIFTRFVKEAKSLADNVPGVAVVAAETNPLERDDVIRRFRAGDIPAVANVGVLSIGFDYPELDCVILARPTMSLAVYYQQVGRAIRTHSRKPSALVIDMVGLVRKFGRIDNMVLKPGGKRGESWAFHSGRKLLTNVVMK